MNIFKAACKVMLSNKVYFFIYVILLGAMGVFVAVGNAGTASSSDFVQQRADVAVIDRDGSALATGAAAALSEHANMIEVADTERALQDAVAQGLVDCLIIVPEGYGEAFVEAARSGAELPRVQTVASFDSTAGYEVENQLQMYLSCVAVHVALDAEGDAEAVAEGMDGAAEGAASADAEGGSVEGAAEAAAGEGAEGVAEGGEGAASASAAAASSSSDVASTNAVLAAAAEAARDDMAAQAEASYAVEEDDASPLPDDYLLYNRWSVYPMVCSVGVLIAVTMAGFNRIDVRRRNLSSPVSGLTLSLGLAAASVVCMLVVWLWITGLGLAAFSSSLAGVEAWRVALCAVDLFAYALFALAFGFLLAQLGASTVVANSASNIVGLVLSFLGGAWIDVRLMGPALEAAGHFTPSYWHGQAVVDIAQADGFTWEALAPAAGDMGMVLLFAAALFAVALVTGRVRMEPTAR